MEQVKKEEAGGKPKNFLEKVKENTEDETSNPRYICTSRRCNLEWFHYYP